MNDTLLAIIFTLAFLLELIPALYALIADRNAPANRAIAVYFTILALNSLSLSSLFGANSLDTSLPWIALYVITTYMIGPAVYVLSVSVLRPAWLRHKWLMYPVYLLVIAPLVLVISDWSGLTQQFLPGPLVFSPPSAASYVGGPVITRDTAAGQISGPLLSLLTLIPAIAMICPMLVVAIKDRKTAPHNARMGWLLVLATAISGLSQTVLFNYFPVSITTLIANLAFAFVFLAAASARWPVTWNLTALQRGLGDWSVFAKLILTIFTIFLPTVLLITLVSSGIVRQNMTEQIGASYNSLARLQARGIADTLITEVENMEGLSESGVLLSALNQRLLDTQTLETSDLRTWLSTEEIDWIESDLSMEDQTPANFATTLSTLVAFQETSPGFDYVQLTDANGGLLSATATPIHFDYSNAGWWRAAYAEGRGATFISVPLRFPDSGSVFVQIGLPVYANDNVTVVGVLMGYYKLDTLLSSLAATQVGEQGRTDLFSPNGIVIPLSGSIPSDPDRQIQLDWGDLLNDEASWRILAYDSVASIVSWTTVGEAFPESVIGEVTWRITVHQPISEALLGVTAAQRASLLAALATTLVAFAFTWVLAGFISRPISSLTSVAERVLDGDLDVRAEVAGKDEVGVLASTFNTMTSRLRELIDSLESQVRARTADLEKQASKLQAASQVGQGVISILDPDELIRTSVNVIRERFDLYYVGLFMVDTDSEWAELRSGTGTAGEQMVGRGHRIRVGEGMIGWSVSSGLPRVAGEAAEDIVRLTTPELPETRSEAAIPMRARGETIGALTVQSERPNEFDETTINILQTVADQLGIAIDNVNLLEQNRSALQDSRQALETVRRTYQQVTRESWTETTQRKQWDLVATPDGVMWKPMGTAAPGKPESDPNSSQDLAVPIKVRDTVVGTIRLKKPAGAESWSAAESQYVESYVSQLGSALDSARLFQEIQTRSVQLQTSSEVGRAANSILNLNELMPMAVNLIGERFQLYYTGLFIVEDDDDGHWAVLRAGTGEAGQSQMEAGHRLEVGGRSMIGQAVEAQEARIAMDVGDEAVRFNNPHLPETRTEMALPLIAGGQSIGALTIQSREPAAFSSEDITVFQTMANQLATAIQNASLFEQSQEATQVAQEQRRVADSLLKSSARFSETIDRTKIFGIISEQIDEQIRPDQVNIFLWDAAAKGFTLSHRYLPGTPEDGYEVGQMVTAEERPDLLHLMTESKSDYLPEVADDGLTHEQFRTPLLVGSEAIGIVEVFHTAHDAHIREEDRAVVVGLIQQAAVALQSAQSFEDMQHALSRTEALYRVGQAAIGMGSLPQLLSAIAETIAGSLPAERVSIMTLDFENERVTHFLQNSSAEAEPAPTFKQLMRGLSGWVIREKKAAVSPKGELDPRDSTMMKIEDLVAGQRSIVVVPLIVHGEVLGTIAAINGPERPDFSEQDSELMLAMASQAAVAIQNSELLAETQATAQNERLLNQIGSNLNQSLDFETILQTAVEEIGQLPNITDVTLTVGDADKTNGESE